MGNQTSTTPSNQGKIRKLRNAVASPLSPIRKIKTNNKPSTVTIPAPQFDWLDCYNVTASNPNPQALPSESTFSDYILHHDQKLGEGAFAKVILATHSRTHEKVAVKIITKKSIPQEMRAYVIKEAGVLAQLKHKNVVGLRLVHEDTNFIYMFLEYMEGGDLHSRLETEGSVSEDDAREWFKQILAALEFTHSHDFCHRDLKLENLLISGEGKKARILMIDYGFAGHMPSEDFLFHDFPGSFCYAAPELIKGIPYRGRSADVYSLGVILYTMLQSTYPFYSEDRRLMTKMILNEDVIFDSYSTAPARELIRWMLAKDPQNRPTLAQIKNHPWICPEVSAIKMIKSPVSPIMNTVSRIKQTARASLSPIPSRRRKQTAI